MALVQIGQDLNAGAGTISGSYVVQNYQVNGKNVSMEDIEDENGDLNTRLVFFKHDKIHLDLVCIDGAVPTTDFVEGGMATHTDFTLFFVDSAVVTRTKSAERVSVDMTKIIIT